MSPIFASLSCVTALVLAAGMPVRAIGQDGYPGKPIRMIVPVAAGAPTDLVMRTAGQELLPRLGQPLIVDNRPGAGLIVGTEACARAAPDGYTVCNVNSDSMSVNPHIVAKLPYDPEKDFKPITTLYYLIQGLIASNSLPVSSVKDLQGMATAKPRALNFGTMGQGTNPDVFRQWLNEQWRTDIEGIPYKGANLIMTALVAGEVDLSRISLSTVGGQMKAGKVKVLAVGSSKRLRLFPEIPTYAEVGLDGFTEQVWWGLAAPAATPDAMVRRLNAEFVRLFREPKFLEYMESQFLETFVGSPESSAKFMREDRERAGVVVKKYNVPRQ